MKRPPAKVRMLLISLVFHASVLSALLLVNGYGDGKGGSGNTDTFSVTWIPGNSGAGDGGNGVDTSIPGDESGNSLELESPVVATPASDHPKLLEVTDPQAVFNDNPAEAISFEEKNPSKTQTLASHTTNPNVATNSKVVSPENSSQANSGMSSEIEEEAQFAGTHEKRKGQGGIGSNGAGGESSSGDGGTVFFGIFARAKQVVYVIDASESMRQHNAMAIACRELWTSLQGLTPNSKFQIVFFNLTNHTMTRPGGKWQLLPVTSDNLRLAKQFLKGIQPDSGTDRFAAITHALSLNPDVIYLLTDVDSPELSTQELNDIQRVNKGRTKIHVVEFGTDADLGGESFLKKLARKNGGEHIYRDLSRSER